MPPLRRLFPLCLTLAVLAAGAASAGAASSIKITRVVPGSAVAGAGIDLTGTGLKGKGTKVTVGGKSAKILTAGAKNLRIVVPKLKPGTYKVLVKRGRSSTSAKLRVLKPFKGSIGVKPDAKRAKTGTIGLGGGEVVATGADGTRYTLRVPAGALTKDEPITVTPATFSGVPFTGGRLAGAALAPEGLQFLTPATLIIQGKSGFPSNTVAFSSSGKGTGVELRHATRDGKSVEVQLEHFSAGGAGSVTEADFVNIVGPILSQRGTLSEEQVRRLLTVMGEFSALFDQPKIFPPYLFCAHQPLCAEVERRALEFLDARVNAACAAGIANHELSALAQLREVLNLEAQRESFNADGPISTDCQHTIMASLIGLASVAGRAVPFDPPLLGFDLPNDVLGDLDGQNGTMNFEFLVKLAGDAAQLGFQDLADTGTANALSALREFPDRGRTRCASNEVGLAGGIADLKIGLRWAELIDPDSILAFFKALDFCRLAVTVSPTQATLATGAQTQFVANVSGLSAPPTNGEVTWSATGGSVDASGKYTAPNEPGTYQVTAKSALNPSRSATANVTVTSRGRVVVTSGGGGGDSSYNLVCAGHAGASDSDEEVFATPAFDAGWKVVKALDCEDHGTYSALSDGVSSQSVSGSPESTDSISGFAQGGMGADADQGPQTLTGRAHATVQFTVQEGSVNYELEGEIKRDCPGTGSPTGDGLELAEFQSNGGPISHSGTLTPGSYTFTIDVGLTRTVSSRDQQGSGCSYEYNYQLNFG